LLIIIPNAAPCKLSAVVVCIASLLTPRGATRAPADRCRRSRVDPQRGAAEEPGLNAEGLEDLRGEDRRPGRRVLRYREAWAAPRVRAHECHGRLAPHRDRARRAPALGLSTVARRGARRLPRQ